MPTLAEVLNAKGETIAEQRARLKAKCESEGGHVYPVSGPPPWRCTFCGYNPPLFSTDK